MTGKFENLSCCPQENGEEKQPCRISQHGGQTHGGRGVTWEGGGALEKEQGSLKCCEKTENAKKAWLEEMEKDER